ncbi:MAG: recombinase family protein [Acidobacteria bacterium]|nr:recombinase family protein [Acidobacteriota bacterium]
MPARRDNSGGSVKRAVYLLRVSTPRQMHTATDIDPEGNSVPTQRKHCDTKCKELRAIKLDEYIEPGHSGQFLDKRPEFQKLLRRIDEQSDVDYVIIYTRSRVFRNYIEAAIVKQQLDKRGVKLISANPNEYYGEGYWAEAMEAITDVFNWVQVKQSGDDIKKKMLNKAQNGGTVGRAKLGYLNVTIKVDGHDVNTIDVDAERSPYIVMAFELAATGTFSNVDDIRAKITDAGLRIPSDKPVSIQQMYKILRDRYYCGYVTYKGVEYKGRHEPLITEELFDQAQKVLDTHSGTGIRQRSHPHYLKGTVWCARCKRRFVVQRAKGRNGGTYYYFFCTGRQDHICDHPYIPVEVMEQAVINHYTRIGLPEQFRTLIQSVISDAAANNNKLSDDMRENLTANLAKLDKKESYFLDLAAEEDWPKDKLREKLAAIRDNRTRIEHRLEHTENQLDDGIQFLTLALDLMTDPHAMYYIGSEAVRTIMNRTIFAKLYVDGDTVTDHELREPFNVLADAYSVWQGYPHQADTAPGKRPSRTTGPRSALHTALPAQRSSAAPEAGHGATGHHTVSPALTLWGQGSNKTPMVGDTGIEPVTSSV